MMDGRKVEDMQFEICKRKVGEMMDQLKEFNPNIPLETINDVIKQINNIVKSKLIDPWPVGDITKIAIEIW